MNWKERAYKEATLLSDKENYPKWLRFRICLMNFIWDWLSWNAFKSGWKMPRLQYKSWKFYKKHPYLKT